MRQQKIKRVGGGYGAKGFMKPKQAKEKKEHVPISHVWKRTLIGKVTPPAKPKKHRVGIKKKAINVPKVDAQKKKKKQKTKQTSTVINQPQIKQPVVVSNLQSLPLSLQIIQPQNIALSRQILEQRIQFIDQMTSPMKNQTAQLQKALSQANTKYDQMNRLYQELESQYKRVNNIINQTSLESKQAQVLYQQTIAAYQALQRSRNQLIAFNNALTSQIQVLQNIPPRIEYKQSPELQNQFARLKMQYQKLQHSNAKKNILIQKYSQLENQYFKLVAQHQRIKLLPPKIQIQYQPDLVSISQLQKMKQQLFQIQQRPAQIKYVTDTQYEQRYFKLLQQHQQVLQQLKKRQKQQKKQPPAKIRYKKVADPQQIQRYNLLFKMYSQLKTEFQRLSSVQPQIRQIHLPLQANPSYLNLAERYGSLQSQYFNIRNQLTDLINNPKIITQFKTPEKQIIYKTPQKQIVFKTPAQRVVFKTPPERLIFVTPQKRQPQKIYVDRWLDRQIIKYKTPEQIYIDKWRSPSAMQQQPLIQRVIQYVPQIRQIYIQGPERLIHVPIQVPGPERIIFKTAEKVIQIDQSKVQQLLLQKQLLTRHKQQLQIHLKQVQEQKAQLQKLNEMIEKQYDDQLFKKQEQINHHKRLVDQLQISFSIRQRQHLLKRTEISQQTKRFRAQMEKMRQKRLDRITAIRRNDSFSIFKQDPIVKKVSQIKSFQIFNRQHSSKQNVQVQWKTPEKEKDLELSGQSSPFNTKLSPFHDNTNNQQDYPNFHENQQEQLNQEQNQQVASQMEQQQQQNSVALQKQYGNDMVFHDVGQMSIVCCWQYTQQQLWIGTKISRTGGSSYYTNQSVHIPKQSIDFLYDAFKKVKSMKLDQNGKAFSRIRYSNVYFIKDTYKQVAFIGLRHCNYYNKERFVTRFGFNLLQSQFTTAMEQWPQIAILLEKQFDE